MPCPLRSSLGIGMVLFLVRCGGGGSPGTPDLPDLTTGDLPAMDLDLPAPDRPGQDLPVPLDLPGEPGEEVAPEDVPATDPGAEAADEEVPTPSRGTCEAPIAVWEGRPLGSALPVGELSYEVLSGPVTGNPLPCAPEGAEGEVVFRLTLDRSLLVGMAAEVTESDSRVAVAILRDACSGPVADCFTSPPEGNIAEDGAVLSPGTWVVVVRTVAPGGATPALDQSLEVSFWFEDTEVCDDRKDNNEDGDADCEDPLCFFDPVCTGGHSGEDCQDPFLVLDGQPVPPGFVFTTHQTLAGRRDDLRPDPDCWATTSQGGDVVFRFVLDQDMNVEASAGFFDGTFAQVFFLDQTCGQMQACIPIDFGEEPFVSTILGPGTWHAVVDFGAERPEDQSFEVFLMFDAP